jgi:hypothetical protein
MDNNSFLTLRLIQSSNFNVQIWGPDISQVSTDKNTFLLHHSLIFSKLGVGAEQYLQKYKSILIFKQKQADINPIFKMIRYFQCDGIKI